jgi:hypothetical protein
MISRNLRRLVATISIIFVSLYPLTAANSSDPYADGRTDAMSFWFDPDMLPGETFINYFGRKQYNYVYKEATILESTNSTYFMINGVNADPNYPDFYGGVQQLYDGRRVAIFSAWDLGKSNCEYFSCKAEDAEIKNRIALLAKGERTTSQRSGGEGTFMQSFIYDFDWKIGQKISWLVGLEPAGTDSLLSVAVKLENQPWEFFASYILPTRFKNGLAGGYGFIEDYGLNTPFVPRTMSLGPTIAETQDGSRDVFTNLYVASSKEKNRHKVTVSGSAVIGQVGSEPQSNSQADYRLRLGLPASMPDYSEGKALIENVVKGKSTRFQEELKRLEEVAVAKAASDENARLEAEAKAKITALREAEAKLVAEQKAKQDAEAKAAAEFKAKQDAEAKAAATMKTTITCVKGKLTKKVSGVKPKCPAGYKKK